MFLKNIWRKKW